MNIDSLSVAVAQAINEQMPKREAGVISMTLCQHYAFVRSLMHKLDKETPKWRPARYGYKAVAGGMTKLIERQCGP